MIGITVKFYDDKVIALIRAIFKPLGLRLYNNSRVVGKRVRFKDSLAKADGVEARDGMVNPPSRYRDGLPSMDHLFALHNNDEGSVSLQEYEDKWAITIDFGDIRPHDDVWTSSSLWFGSKNPTSVRLEGKLLGDNLPEPIKCTLDIRFEVERRPVNLEEDILPYQG